MGLRLIVCGGRDYENYDQLCQVLNKIHALKTIDMIIEGGAKGADAHAAIWADNNFIPRVTCHANWMKLGAKAGPIRNTTMLTLSPDGVVAFDGGKGTKNMIKQAEAKGFKVMTIDKS